MRKRLFLTLMLLAVLAISAPAGLAQDDDRPTIAILRFGEVTDVIPTEIGIFEVLQAHGLLTFEEFTSLYLHQYLTDHLDDFEGEQINILRGDPGEDFATINLMIEQTLDQDADVIIAISTPVTQVAVHATLDMDDPPAVLFTAVYDPYAAGIAQASCIKPAHVTGVAIVAAYDEVISALLLQDPDIEAIGAIYSASEITGQLGAEDIAAAAEARGLRVEQLAVTGMSDLRLAAEGLIGRGIQAFVIPADIITAKGIPILAAVADEYGIPIFHSSTSSIMMGITAGVSSSFAYQRGVSVGHILAAWLNGEIDIAATAVSVFSDSTIAVSKDTAKRLDIEIADELEDSASLVFEDGKLHMGPDAFNEADVPRFMLMMAKSGQLDATLDAPGNPMTRETLELWKQMDLPPDLTVLGEEFVAGLTCTPEQIAAEQAELDARGE